MPNRESASERQTVGKGTIKVKKKCCKSQPPCKSCPIVVLRSLLREAKAEEVKKTQKKAKKGAKKKSIK
ncbi:hypothetical protein [Saccharopolyspora phatthalungensis]|uniref:hypothetical protein n=1 Tax=Saccharopolyspora phatthalungensis TaxID=664693 RepID=UPI001612A4D7|nr:hypothetical protein [Saccharopolyspora phatthalungensis]